mmetsp:Transcript_23618/g.59136  ORF Transcript_23618/g.59136 Transcript_23618/m.59136 type:complete len:326 (-) Transcript_23618:871-1848(-)
MRKTRRNESPVWKTYAHIIVLVGVEVFTGNFQQEVFQGALRIDLQGDAALQVEAGDDFGEVHLDTQEGPRGARRVGPAKRSHCFVIPCESLPPLPVLLHRCQKAFDPWVHSNEQGRSVVPCSLHICAVCNKQLHHRLVAFASSNVQRGLAVSVCSINIGLQFDEQFAKRCRPNGSGLVKGSLAFVVADVDIRAVLDRRFHDSLHKQGPAGGLVVLHKQVDDGCMVIADKASICAAPNEQQLEKVEVVLGCRAVQRRPTALVLQVHVKRLALLDEMTQHVYTAFLTQHMHHGLALLINVGQCPCVPVNKVLHLIQRAHLADEVLAC